jgi:hypothetical protein
MNGWLTSTVLPIILFLALLWLLKFCFTFGDKVSDKFNKLQQLPAAQHVKAAIGADNIQGAKTLAFRSGVVASVALACVSPLSGLVCITVPLYYHYASRFRNIDVSVKRKRELEETMRVDLDEQVAQARERLANVISATAAPSSKNVDNVPLEDEIAALRDVLADLEAQATPKKTPTTTTTATEYLNEAMKTVGPADVGALAAVLAIVYMCVPAPSEKEKGTPEGKAMEQFYGSPTFPNFLYLMKIVSHDTLTVAENVVTATSLTMCIEKAYTYYFEKKDADAKTRALVGLGIFLMLSTTHRNIRPFSRFFHFGEPDPVKDASRASLFDTRTFHNEQAARYNSDGSVNPSFVPGKTQFNAVPPPDSFSKVSYNGSYIPNLSPSSSSSSQDGEQEKKGKGKGKRIGAMKKAKKSHKGMHWYPDGTEDFQAEDYRFILMDDDGYRVRSYMRGDRYEQSDDMGYFTGDQVCDYDDEEANVYAFDGADYYPVSFTESRPVAPRCVAKNPAPLSPAQAGSSADETPSAIKQEFKMWIPQCFYLFVKGVKSLERTKKVKILKSNVLLAKNIQETKQRICTVLNENVAQRETIEQNQKEVSDFVDSQVSQVSNIFELKAKLVKAIKSLLPKSVSWPNPVECPPDWNSVSELKDDIVAEKARVLLKEIALDEREKQISKTAAKKEVATLLKKKQKLENETRKLEQKKAKLAREREEKALLDAAIKKNKGKNSKESKLDSKPLPTHHSVGRVCHGGEAIGVAYPIHRNVECFFLTAQHVIAGVAKEDLEVSFLGVTARVKRVMGASAQGTHYDVVVLITEGMPRLDKSYFKSHSMGLYTGQKKGFIVTHEGLSHPSINKVSLFTASGGVFHDGSTSPGDSGSPIITEEGECIGLHIEGHGTKNKLVAFDTGFYACRFPFLVPGIASKGAMAVAYPTN